MNWSPDGSRLVLALQDGAADQLILSSIKILNVDSGNLEQTLLDKGSINNYSLSVVDWSTSGVIVYANEAKLVFWDPSSNTELGSVNASDTIMNAVWAPDSQHIATLNADRTIQVWDINSSLSAPQQTISIVADKFISHYMSWIGDNLLAVNIWTNVEIWNVPRASLEENIETDHFIFGVGTLANNELAFAGPQSVSTYTLTVSPTPTPTFTVTFTATATSTATATMTPTYRVHFGITPIIKRRFD